MSGRDPFYSVETSKGFSLTQYITSFTFEDVAGDEDSMLRIILGKLNNDIIDRVDLVDGEKIYFHFGLKGGGSSNKRYAIIKNFDARYGRGVMGTIVALDKGNDLRKRTSWRVYGLMTASDIASDIADAFGLQKRIEKTTTGYDSYMQANRNYSDVLDNLVKNEEGHWEWFIKSNILHFRKKDLSSSSYKTYRYRNGDGDLVEFAPSHKGAENDGSEKDVEVVDYDYVNKKPIKQNADNEEKGLGTWRGNSSGELTKVESGKIIVAPVSSDGEARGIATQKKRDAQMKNLEASIKFAPDPNLESDEIITITGVANKHIGNYRLIKVTHKIDGGGYTCFCDAEKDATSAALTKDGDKTTGGNNSVGPKDGDKKVKIWRGDSVGNLNLQDV